MSRSTRSTHLRMVVTIAIGATAATAWVTARDARAQAPDPTAHQAASTETPASRSARGKVTPTRSAPGKVTPGLPTLAQQRKALALMAEGKALAQEFLLTDAIAKYREAITYWDHPIAHYNLSRLLNAVERPLEAYWSVEHALGFGPAGLADDPMQARQIHAHLLRLRDQLRARLVEIQIASAAPAVEVSVGNRAVGTAPAKSELFLPGTHRLAAQAPRHWPLLQAMSLESGDTVHLSLSSQRAFTPWKPWALTGAGTAVALAGFGVYWHGRDQRSDLARQVRRLCDPSCPSTMRESFDRDWRRVRTLQHVGVGTLITGGSVALLGAGLVLWNQRRELRLIGDEEHPVSILPVASPEMTGLVGTTTF